MKTLKEKRIDAVYKYRNCSTGNKRNDMLDILLALATDKQLRILIEELSIKVK